MIPYIANDDILSDLGYDLARSHYDNNRDGVPDVAALWKVRCDATSRVRTALGGVFPNLPVDTTLTVASIDKVNHRIVFAAAHGFLFRSRIIFVGEDVPTGLEGILRIDGLHFARKVTETSFEISNVPGGPRIELTAYTTPLPALGVVPHIPDQVVTLTRQAAVVEALKTIPKLNRGSEWKAYDDALERAFSQLTRGPNVLDMNRSPVDPAANQETFTVDAPAVLWAPICPPRYPTGMY